MIRTNLPRAIRHLRRRRGWRQTDLGATAGVSRESVSRLERGKIGGIPIATIERLAAALEADLYLTVRWQGAELDRLVDSSHASLVETTVSELEARGWVARTEVSFNHFGDRGRVDILALWPPLAVVLICEVKSAIGDLQATMGALDVKLRLVRVIASSVGWEVAAASSALIIGDSRTARRVVAAHPSAFARFTLRGRTARAWLRQPHRPPPTGRLWFTKPPDSHRVTRTRVRVGRTVRNPP